MKRGSTSGCAPRILPSFAPRCGEAASRLRAEAADQDARTEAEACDLAEELQEAPMCEAWSETLAVVRELDPEGAEALAAAAVAWDRAIERAPFAGAGTPARSVVGSAADGAGGGAHERPARRCSMMAASAAGGGVASSR